MKYIGFTCAQTLDHIHKMRSRFSKAELDVSWCAPRPHGPVQLVPLLQWYDSTHVCTTQYYRDFVFAPEPRRVAPGGFIEDRMAALQLADLLAAGRAGHAIYGTYLLHAAEAQVSHIDGKHFMTEAQRRERGFPPLPTALAPPSSPGPCAGDDSSNTTDAPAIIGDCPD